MAIREAGLWNDTILVFGSDNGGPSLVGGPSNANNYPLRGGKGNDFAGGTRTAAMVSGGALPAAARGTKYAGMVHVADWYATLCSLGGGSSSSCADVTEHPIPSSTSFDVWASIVSGNNASSPRQEALLSYRSFDGNSGACIPGNETTLAQRSHPSLRTGHYTAWSQPTSDGVPMDEDEPPAGVFEAAEASSALFDGAILRGDMKYIQGTQSGSGYWWGPQYPNATTKLPFDAPGCPAGCLFNMTADPGEHIDLSH